MEGVGKVGRHLAQLLVDAGAAVVATDVNSAALERLRSALPSSRAVATLGGSISTSMSPCAMGAALSESPVRELRARIVCGAANNQLATPQVEYALGDRSIVWVPDYVANSGGLIQWPARSISSAARRPSCRWTGSSMWSPRC